MASDRRDDFSFGDRQGLDRQIGDAVANDGIVETGGNGVPLDEPEGWFPRFAGQRVKQVSLADLSRVAVSRMIMVGR